jgi:hypothetical protein
VKGQTIFKAIKYAFLASILNLTALGEERPGSYSEESRQTDLKVLFIAAESTALQEDHVVVSGGRSRQLTVGERFDCMRKAKRHLTPADSSSLWVKTGVIKIVEVYADQALAVVLEQNLASANIMFPQYPLIMADDTLFYQNLQVERAPLISPVKTVMYADLFVDPKSYPATLEMSAEGMKALERIMTYYEGLRAPLLIIEGHTDEEGSAQANQIESYQRALTVRQYVVEKLGFDPERVVALGFGESSPPDRNHEPGYQRKHRRIVFKVNSSVQRE